VDQKLQGISWKAPVRVAATSNYAASNNGSGVLTASANGALSLGGISSFTAADRVLLTAQTTAADNGIYVVTNAGGASAQAVLTRAGDADSSAELQSAAAFVGEGSEANKAYVQTTGGTITMNSTSLAFVAFSSTTVTAGDGLGSSGSTLSVNVDDSTIETNSDAIRVKAAGIGVSHLAAAVAGDGLSGGAGSALAVSVDDSTIETNSDSIRVKAAGIGVSHLASAVAGDGLTGGAGSALAVNVDDSSIETDSDAIRVKAAGIGVSHLAAAVAGDGLSGGAGSALSVSVDDSTIETNSDSIRVKDGGITSAKLDTNIAISGTCQAVSFQATSDMRKKENVQPMSPDECLEKVLRAEAVRYNFKEGPECHRRRVGFIAQDCEHWCSESVVDGEDGYKSISYMDWVPLLCGAVQSLTRQVKELKG
jgi:hypothetical protein